MENKKKINRAITWAVIGWFLVALLSYLYYGKRTEQGQQATVGDFVGALSPNIAAALIGFVVAKRVYRSIYDDEKKIEHTQIVEAIASRLTEAKQLLDVKELLEKTLGKWNRPWKPEEICRSHIDCPEVLKNIYSKYDLTALAPQAYLSRANRLLLARLDYFDDQISNIEKGQWELVAKDGSLLTDADLTYEIISKEILKEILKERSGVIVKACTIFPYIEWWLTRIGLNYLQSQRDFGVDRTFFFPSGLYSLIFKELNLESISQADAKKFLKNKYPHYSLHAKLIRNIIFMHYCLGIKVSLLSEAMIVDKGIDEKDKNIISNWQEYDTVIIQKGPPASPDNICAIQIETIPSVTGPYLFAKKGTVYFKDDDIEGLIMPYGVIVKHATDFSKLIKKAEFGPFRLELENMANVLGYNLSNGSYDINCDLNDPVVKQKIYNLIK